MKPFIPGSILRKVLIISPHFAPINAPDMQRTRLMLPYLRSLGWEPVVLAVSPEMVEGGVLEPLLEKTYPSDIRIVRVHGISPKLTRPFGFGSLWWRCGRALRAAGDRLLRTEEFDLVFFSSTQFGTFTLGPRWKALFGVPYILDYQDPWTNDYYKKTGVRPPGGRFKFGVAQSFARRHEPKVLQKASGIVAVSSAYGAMLAKRYASFDASRVIFLPFGAAVADFSLARAHIPAESLIDFGDGLTHMVYTGRCGPDMSTALKILFRAFKEFLGKRPDLARRLRFHFVGTDYAPRPLGRDWVMPTARDEGVEAYVSEFHYRVPYFDALYYLTHADALVAIGSNDPSYSASKLFPYVLSHRPLLIIFHSDSPVLAMAESMKCGLRFSFVGRDDIGSVASAVADQWFLGDKMTEIIEPDLSAFHPYSAETMTRRIAACFDSAIEGEKARR
jgi:hypothetical protein